MLAGMSPRSVINAALACLAIALTGCAGAVSTHTVAHPIVPSRLQLTGTALKSALLPLPAFPAGYQIDTRGTSDSGSTLLGSPSPTPAPQNCQQLIQATNYPSAGLTAFVLEFLYDATVDHPSAYHQRGYDQRIYQFATTSGSTGYFDSVRTMVSHCSSVTAKAGANTMVIKQTASLASPVAGHEALLVREAITAHSANGDSVELYAIDGTDVDVIGAVVFGVPLTAQPSSLTALMAKLIARVRAAG